MLLVFRCLCKSLTEQSPVLARLEMTDGFTTKTMVVFSFILNLSDFLQSLFLVVFHQWSICVLKVCKTESEHFEDNRK